MTHSDTIIKIAPALLSAQRTGNAQEEARLLPIALKLIRADVARQQTLKDKFMSRVVMTFTDCWYWTGAIDKNTGYGIATYLGEGKAHRLSYRLFNGILPNDLDVLHKCDVRSCVNPDHLFTGTQADNVRDMISKGRQSYPKEKHGEDNPKAKLKAHQVIEIRERYKNGTKINELATDYGISRMCAYRAAKKISWKHIV